MSQKEKLLQEEMDAFYKQMELQSLRMRATTLRGKLEALLQRQRMLLAKQEEPSGTKDEKEMRSIVLEDLNQEIVQLREQIAQLTGNTAEVPDS